MASVTGGGRLEARLGALAHRMTSGEVQVGFLPATYPNEASPDRFLKGVANHTGKAVPAPAPPRSRAAALYVAQVAFWNNFGNLRTPARPFFTNTVRDNSPAWGDDLAKIAKATDYDTSRTLSLMGERIRDQIVKAIVDWPADNSELTVAIKGFNKGLIDRGIMQRSVDYLVEKK